MRNLRNLQGGGAGFRAPVQVRPRNTSDIWTTQDHTEVTAGLQWSPNPSPMTLQPPCGHSPVPPGGLCNAVKVTAALPGRPKHSTQDCAQHLVLDMGNKPPLSWACICCGRFHDISEQGFYLGPQNGAPVNSGGLTCVRCAHGCVLSGLCWPCAVLLPTVVTDPCLLPRA